MTDEQAEAPDCVILGAGFSKAVSTAMPVLWELGDLVLDRLALPKDTLRPFGGDLERWLSHLAIDQPWLSSADNLMNRAMFLQASEAVGNCIDEAEATVISQPPPQWLIRLMLDWARREVAIITFNYDLIIERLAEHVLGLVGSLGDLYGMPIVHRLPLGSGMRYGASPPIWRTPTLFKLHGSTNWGYGGIDAPPSDQVTLLPKPLSWPSRGEGDPETARRQRFLYDGLDPLIVPPAGTKNDFYRNRALRAQWMQVSRLLRRAQRLTIIGFSFPPTDLQVRQLVATSIGRPEVEVVDRRPDVAEIVREMIDPAAAMELYSGASPLPEFIDATCADVVRWTLHRSNDTSPDHRARVTLNGEATFEERLNADQRTAEDQLATYLDGRWPGIRDRALRDRSDTSEPERCCFAFLASVPGSAS